MIACDASPPEPFHWTFFQLGLIGLSHILTSHKFVSDSQMEGQKEAYTCQDDAATKLVKKHCHFEILPPNLSCAEAMFKVCDSYRRGG